MSTVNNPFANVNVPGATASQPAVGGSPQPFTNGAASAASPEQTQAVPDALIDINSDLLTSESLTAKEGDAFATPPPPPDAIYRVKLSLRGVKSDDIGGADLGQYASAPGGDTAFWVPGIAKDRSGNQTGVFAKTIINVQVADPKYPEYDGAFLQVPFKWTDTRVSNKGLSKIMTILTLAGKRPDGNPWVVLGQQYGHKQLMEIFLKFLAGEPELRVRSEWSWNCEQCGQIGKQTGNYAKSIDGMNKFPQVKPGVYSPEMRCQVNPAHGFSKARALAVQYFSLDGAVVK